MQILVYLGLSVAVLVVVLPGLQSYMRMLVNEAEDMEKFYNA
jgi:hypothetical protein